MDGAPPAAELHQTMHLLEQLVLLARLAVFLRAVRRHPGERPMLVIDSIDDAYA